MLVALLEVLPVAFGTVLATLPLVSVSLLLADRPELNAYLAFLAGWISGAVIVGGLAIAVSDLSTQGQNPSGKMGNLASARCWSWLDRTGCPQVSNLGCTRRSKAKMDARTATDETTKNVWHRRRIGGT